jgi:hypothetical protein
MFIRSSFLDLENAPNELRLLVRTSLYSLLPAKVQTLSNDPPAKQLPAVTHFLTYRKKNVTLPAWRMVSPAARQGGHFDEIEPTGEST